MSPMREPGRLHRDRDWRWAAPYGTTSCPVVRLLPRRYAGDSDARVTPPGRDEEVAAAGSAERSGRAL